VRKVLQQRLSLVSGEVTEAKKWPVMTNMVVVVLAASDEAKL